MSNNAEKIETPPEHSAPVGGVLGEKMPYAEVFATTPDADESREHNVEA